MSLNTNEMGPADFMAMNGNSGWGGDGAWWLLVLFLFAFNGGWGNGFGGGYGGTGAEVQRGFDQNATMSALTGISNTLNSGFANAETARWATQTNLTDQLNTIAMAQQNCCCENRAAIADLKYTIATEACADRAVVSDGVRDIIASNTANTQAILDKLCQQEIDALKTQNANLQTQINMANMQASQTAQTARILADNAAQTVALEQYLNPAPVPAYMVQNPNCCPNNFSGCGCGSF